MSTSRQHRPSRRALPAAVLPVLLALGLVACGEGADDAGGSPSSSASASSPESSAPAGQEAFAECLAEQGIELPAEGETPDLESFDRAQLQSAMEECGDLAPSDLPSGAPGDSAPDQSALDAFAECMKDRDIVVEPSLEAIRELDPDDRAVQRAVEACAPLIGP